MSWTFLLKVWPLFRCSRMAAFGCSLRLTADFSLGNSITSPRWSRGNHFTFFRKEISNVKFNHFRHNITTSPGYITHLLAICFLGPEAMAAWSDLIDPISQSATVKHSNNYATYGDKRQ